MKFFPLLLLLAFLTGMAPVVAMECPEGQELTPPHSVSMYLDGFHNYAGQEKLPKEKQLQLRVSHYCKQLRPDLFQCIVYQGNGKDAKLLGVEYVITKEAYAKLSAKEKKSWHPHDGEVDSGMLAMPGLDPAKEKETLAFVRTTFGKTWHAWQPGDEMPIGPARLMWAVPPNDANAQTIKDMAARKANPAY